VIVAGIPSVVEFSPRLMAVESGQPPVCVRFFVYAVRGRVRGVRITTTGLGDARFVAPDRGPAADCKSALRDALPLISLGEVGESGRQLQMVLPREVFPLSRKPQQGRVLVFADSGPPVEVPLQVQREAAGQFGTAMLWFSGIFLPALVAAALGYAGHVLVERYRAREAEATEFARFKEDRRNDLDSFFGVFYPQLLEAKPSPDEFATRIETGLEEPLSKVPRKRRDALRAELRRRDRTRIIECLVAAFPEWEPQIRKSTGAGTDGRVNSGRNDD
jgi:hypothetical protein